MAPAPNSEAMYEFLAARRAEAADDPGAAEAALKRAVALDPTSAELRAEQAGFFARQNRAADAVAAAEQAVGLDAGSEEGHRILGLVNAAWADGTVEGPKGGTEQQWRTKAIEHLGRIQNSPAMATDLGLQMTLARQMMASGDAAKAIPLLERIVGQAGNAVEPLAMLADAHRSLGQFDQAAAALEQAAQANPRYYLALGDVYERQDKWEEAADAYEKGLGATRGSGRELRLRRAAALLNVPDGGGAERAIAVLTEFLKANPKDIAGQMLLAQAYLQRGAGEDAERAAKAALAIEPNNLQALGLLAGVYRERYDFAAIVSLLTPTTRDDATPSGPRVGEFVRLLAELGGAQQQIGESAAAVRTFERARQLLPESPQVAVALAQAHLQAGQYAQAERVARDARVVSDGNVALLRVEALAGVKAGRAADAVGFLERSLGSKRDEPGAAFALADVYEEAGRFDDSIKVVTALDGPAPSDDGVAFRLAAAYESANRVPDAERLFRAILAPRSAQRQYAQLLRLHAGGSRPAPRRGAAAHRPRAGHRARQSRVSRQPRLGAVQARTRRRCRGAAAPRHHGAAREFGDPVPLRRRAGRARQARRRRGGRGAGAGRRRPGRGQGRARAPAPAAAPAIAMTAAAGSAGRRLRPPRESRRRARGLR